MTFLTGRRAFGYIATAALTVYGVVSVATWAFLLWLGARHSRGSLTRDLFGVVLAVAAVAGS